MSKSTPALILYLVSSLIYVLSVVFHWDESITFLFKPMMMPAILFYYWQECKGNVGIIPVFSLVLFFIGDMLILIEYENLLVPLMLLNLIAYLLIGCYLVKDLLRIKNPEVSLYTVLIVCIVIGFLLSLLYAALRLVFDTSDTNYGLLTIYGITLVLLGIGTVVYYVLKSDSASFYLSITMLCLVLCDLFYVLYNHYAPLSVFININVFSQSVSFYFIVKYFLAREEEQNLPETK